MALFPDNEVVLRPYLNSIVSTGMKLAQRVQRPLNYFTLLRALFRSIGGGKFELLYKEFLPLLPDLLRGGYKGRSYCHTQNCCCRPHGDARTRS